MLPIDSAELLQACDRLRQGDVVVIPTETVYGLAASIDSEKGLRKIFSLKRRPFFDPLIVHVASFKEAASVVREWPPVGDFLARLFWPGPLTLVLPKADRVHPLITSGLETVAVRFPSHPIARDLIRLTGSPLAAPSANFFGRASPSRAEHVRSEFSSELDGEDLLIIDGGECAVGLESTVVSIHRDTQEAKDIVTILRPGGVTEEMLKSALERWSQKVAIARSESPASPGHTKHHYMPRIPLVVVAQNEPVGLSLPTRQKIQRELKLSSIANPRELELNPDAVLAARELYSEMRRLAADSDLLVVRFGDNQRGGLWDAIWDRIRRAASLNFAEE